MPDSEFVVGGRYRTLLGWYEVLEVREADIRVRYEKTEEEDVIPIKAAARIHEKIQREEEQDSCPYGDDSENDRYFWTLGFLSRAGFIEAIIPPKSRGGFDLNYRQLKGRPPRRGQTGYYVHHSADVDKWGVEMRLTFPSNSPRPASELLFGWVYNIVDSPNPAELRINSNDLCYELLRLGFDLGSEHDVEAIEAHVPERFRPAFQAGRSAGG